MSRTRLFAVARRALVRARACLPDALPPGPRAISRRAALVMLTAGAAAACSPRAKPEAAMEPDTRPVAIIGGGTSGLVVAWRLASAGVKSTIYESSGRTGGRMFTQRDFTPEGLFCELGGELVDSNHEALIALCGELGIGIQRLRPEGDASSDVYDFGGTSYTVTDLLDPAAQTGGFLPIAARIAADQAALLDADDNWTARALELDSLPLSDYLASLRGSTDDWVIDFLDLAYQGEYGLPTSQQSALNLVDYISTDTAATFSVFGDSDEAHRIAGGSGTLPETLTARLASPQLSPYASIHLRHELSSLARDADGFTLGFRTPDGTAEVQTGRLVLALPFTRLRTIDGLGGLGLSADKMRAINELGYGANAKLMVATSSRPWRDASILGLNAPVTGSVYSDRGFQQIWDTSVAQEGMGGIITNFLSDKAAKGEEASALAALESGLRALSPELARSLSPETRASFFWPKHPHTLASYSAARVGQYTGLFEHAAAPAFDGALQFAGEHTSVDGYGFMNGAVDAGERVARELLA